MINFDSLPQEAPLQEFVPGRYPVTVAEVEIGLSKSSQVKQMVVTFKIEGTNMTTREYYQDSNKAFMGYKLGRLVNALKLQLQGASLELEDLAKLIRKGSTCEAYLDKNDKGYPQLSYKDKDKSWGLYPDTDKVDANPVAEALNISSDDLPF